MFVEPSVLLFWVMSLMVFYETFLSALLWSYCWPVGFFGGEWGTGAGLNYIQWHSGAIPESAVQGYKSASAIGRQVSQFLYYSSAPEASMLSVLGYVTSGEAMMGQSVESSEPQKMIIKGVWPHVWNKVGFAHHLGISPSNSTISTKTALQG